MNTQDFETRALDFVRQTAISDALGYNSGEIKVKYNKAKDEFHTSYTNNSKEFCYSHSANDYCADCEPVAIVPTWSIDYDLYNEYKDLVVREDNGEQVTEQEFDDVKTEIETHEVFEYDTDNIGRHISEYADKYIN